MKTPRKSQNGQALVILTLSAVILMALTGLGIDVANLFLKKARLQAAIDAATIAGITSLVTRVSETSDPGPTTTLAAETAAKQIAAFNIQQMGLMEGSLAEIEQLIDATATVHPVTREMTLSVSATLSVNTLFVDIIGLADHTDVSASGEARRNPAIVSLVLDRSGSMDCLGSCPGKLQAMKDGAIAFINTFLINVDHLALISFNHIATVDQDMGLLTNLAKQAMVDAINAIAAGGGTNIAEGIQLGRLEIENFIEDNPESTRQAVEAIGLVSDGAPGAIKANLLQPDPTPPGGSPLQPNVGSEYHYYPIPYNDNTDRIYDSNSNGQPCGSIQNCLLDFSYLDSKGNLQGFNQSGGTITNLNELGNSELRKEMYDLAVIEADYAKDFRNPSDPEDTGITIYTVGLGDASTNNSDPYQSASETIKIKPILLRKLANDAQAAGDPIFQPVSVNFDPNQPEGVYLETPNSGELEVLFLEIARRIQLKLIE